MRPRSPRAVVVWLALWLTIVGNLSLWRELTRIASEAQSSTLLFPGVVVFVFAGVAQHFMLGYGAVMDTAMLANTMQTDAAVQRRGTDLACLRGRENEPLSHDNLYHTALGVLDVVTPTYRSALDVFAPCRRLR